MTTRTSADTTVSLRPDYLDNGNVQSLALAVRDAMQQGECPKDIYARMSILSDVLEDAGCSDYDILAHLRLQNHQHVQDCWVLRKILGPPWKIFKTITIGTKNLQTPADFRQELQRNNIQANAWSWSKDLLGKMPISKEETTLDLVVISVADLGFPKGATLQQIYERATLEFGLCLCPAEAGPQLRLQYPDQPDNNWIFIAMEPIAGSGGILYVFDVARCDSDLWLNASWANLSGDVWLSDRHFVFRVSCK